jgi:hypothetical protein
MIPEKIISGGQTGVDRAALDVALALDIPCGGWCPRGRRAEDGIIPDRYPLTETAAFYYECRTEWNVRDSDGTLILNRGPLEGGTAFTEKLAKHYKRPVLVMALENLPDPGQITEWIQHYQIAILNVAGPRESGRPGIYHQAFAYLSRVFQSGR